MVNARARRLILGLAVMLGAALMAGAGRLTVLATEDRGRAERLADQRTLRREVLPARRGTLRDRHGRLLATDVDTLQVEVLPRNLKGRKKTAGDRARLVRDVAGWLSPRLGVPEQQLQRSLARDRWARLGEPVSDPDLMDELEVQARDLLWGLDLVPGTERRYPWGAAAGNLVGYVDHEGRGVAGLEQGLQRELEGADGVRRFHAAPGGRRLATDDGEQLPPLHGLDVTLTLDVRMQQMVEQELMTVLAEQEARRAFAVVLDSRTCEILCLASVPTVDPSDGSDRGRDGTVLGGIQEVYAPGSTFKPLMMATALELGIVREGQLIDCTRENGLYKGRRVKDTHPQDRMLSLEEVLIHSSNIGMAEILTSIVAEDTPRDRQAMKPIRDMLVKLGLGSAVGLPLPAESAGHITDLDKWHRTWTLTSVSFGQELALTAVQMAAAVNTLTDGGWRRPTLVKALRDGDEELPLPLAAEPRRVFSEAHADLVRGWMTEVVGQGSCAEMRELGIPVAGKTGTADSETTKGREIHSYTALVPAEDPAITLVVVVSEPRHARYSSESAAPAAGRILGRILPYLGYDLP